MGGRLTIGQLYAVAVVLGIAKIVHGAASISYLPVLVEPHLLQRANSRLGAASSVADSAGSALGAALIGPVGAARSVIVDVLSYLVSTFLVGRIRTPETTAPRPRCRSLARDISEGLHYVAGQPMTATAFGMIMGVGGVGSLAGAHSSPRRSPPVSASGRRSSSASRPALWRRCPSCSPDPACVGRSPSPWSSTSGFAPPSRSARSSNSSRSPSCSSPLSARCGTCPPRRRPQRRLPPAQDLHDDDRDRRVLGSPLAQGRRYRQFDEPETRLLNEYLEPGRGRPALEWARLKPHLPTSGQRCGRWATHRRVNNGILCRLRTGCRGGISLRVSGHGRRCT